ncbi:MAG TPA: metal ABC transporter ATP-binding protein [Thermomicrobiales bacterium]|nr:metal ABC transporter ATP-binding protein [Thermomicrobiales bacterium]
MDSTATAIQLNHVACGYDGPPVLRDVSVTVAPGEFVGMIGPSGAGKTTLLRAMLGLAPRVSGEVRVGGRPVVANRPPAGVGYVPQVETVDWHFPVTVENVVLLGKVGETRRLPWPSREDRRDVADVLDRLGIGQLRNRHIRDLSGGQQQRTFLARALIGRPRILFLDEPTASIDIKTRDDILRLLVELNGNGVTIVMTTHELNTVAAYLPHVVCINGGIVAQGAPSAIFTGPILSRTFNTEMRVVRDAETGHLLVAEAGGFQLSAISAQRSTADDEQEPSRPSLVEFDRAQRIHSTYEREKLIAKG